MAIESVAEWTAIIVAIVGAISATFVTFIPSYTNYLIKRLEIKEKQASIDKQQSNQKALIHDIRSTDTLKDLLRNIQQEINCSRINVWMFHNGGYFYTGEAIQRMTMIVEHNEDGLEPIKHKFTGVPVRIFARNLIKLTDKNTLYTHERNELAYNDALSVINQENKVTSSSLFKIKSTDDKDWTGILAIAWVSHKELTQEQVDYVIEQTQLISQVLSPQYLNS